MEIYVSSVAFGKQDVDEIIRKCSIHNWALEFSSGLSFREDMSEVFKQASIKKMIHNYFPAPEVPFVINLASRDKNILSKSINHCKQGIDLTKSVSAPYYSAHAGFCVDPNPEELGKGIKRNVKLDRKVCFDIFLTSVRELVSYAENANVGFLIENNVTNKDNFGYYGENPFLCSESEDIKWLFDTVKSENFGFLLDTAHLKVSCETMQLDKEEQLYAIKKNIKYIHHSENNGLVDDNKPVGEDYWFLKFMSEFKDVVHVIEVKDLSTKEIPQQISLLRRYGS